MMAGKRAFVTCVTVFVAALMGFSQPAFGSFSISDEGTVCAGGGTRAYQYTVRNNTSAAVSIDQFYVGTDDLSVGNYSNWTAPGGWTAQATVNSWINLPPTLSAMYTNNAQTPHGVVPPQAPQIKTAGAIVWNGPAIVLQSNQTITLGFDNINTYQDTEWLAELTGTATVDVGFITLPIAGPTGVFSGGWVHAPVPEPTTMCLLAIGGACLLRRRRQSS